MIQLNKVKEAEDSKQEESMEKDPLFMNIDKIAKLPMASKKPIKIVTSQSLLDYDRNNVPNHTKTSQLQMQTKLIENVDERKSQLKKKI